MGAWYATWRVISWPLSPASETSIRMVSPGCASRREAGDRKSAVWGKRVDIGGGRVIKKKKNRGKQDQDMECMRTRARRVQPAPTRRLLDTIALGVWS